MIRALPALLVTLCLAAAAHAQKVGPAFEQEPYGKLPPSMEKKAKKDEPRLVTQYTLINRNNVVVKCIDYGAIITEIHVPDKNGKFADIALGFDKLDGYLKGHP